MTEVNEEMNVSSTTHVTPIAAAAAAGAGLNQLRRIRRARTSYEKLQRPDDIPPGHPIPSIEGWVVFLANLPAETAQVDIEDFFATYKSDDPDYFGVIRDIKMPLDKDCLCPGYALVELETREGFDRALAELSGAVLPFGDKERTLSVFPAFLGEEDDQEEQEAEPIPGDKRARD